MDVIEDPPNIAGKRFNVSDKIQRQARHTQNIVLNGPMGIDGRSGFMATITSPATTGSRRPVHRRR